MREHLSFVLFVLLSNVRPWDLAGFLRPIFYDCYKNELAPASSHGCILLAEAKGVAGLGKAGGEGQGGADKAGQQVPPEVYMALTYAGTLFLFTLSVPLILYGLNKLLNKIEDCFGCGPASRAARKGTTGATEKQPDRGKHTNGQVVRSNNNGHTKQIDRQEPIGTISGLLLDTQSQANNASHHHHPSEGLSNGGSIGGGGGSSSSTSASRQQYHQNQRLHLQMLQQYPKYTQFISMSNPDYNPPAAAASAVVEACEPPALIDRSLVTPGHAYPLRGSSPLLQSSRHTSANSNHASPTNLMMPSN